MKIPLSNQQVFDKINDVTTIFNVFLIKVAWSEFRGFTNNAQKTAFSVKQATIRTVFKVKSAKGHTTVSALGSFLKKDEPILIDSS